MSRWLYLEFWLGRSIPALSLDANCRLQPEATVKQIGDALMSRFALPLEVIGLLLTVALIGAVTIAMREKQEVR